jgi:hypothetical protein
MKVISDLTDKQQKYIKEHALELFEATMLPPSDLPEDVIVSTCRCCEKRRNFLHELIKHK